MGMTNQEARDERETLIARAREVSGALEEYEFEGAAGEAAGLLNSLADALDQKHPEPEWEYATARPTWPSVPVNRYRHRETALRAVEHPPVGERPGGWIAIQRQVVKPGPWVPVGEGE